MEAAAILSLAIPPCGAHDSLLIVPRFGKVSSCFPEVINGTRQILALAITGTIVINYLRNAMKRVKIPTRVKKLHKTKSSIFCSLK